MVKELILPRLNANDTSVRLVAWLAGDGEKVSRGDPVCAVETTKASAEMEAEADGYLRHAASEGEELDVGALVGWIGESPGEIQGLSRKEEADRPAVTRKARELARTLGVEIHEIPGRGGIVREKDVRAWADSRKKEAPAARPPAGRIDPAFLDRIRSDPSFRRLGSAEKIEAYRSHGAVIGEGVVIGEGAILDCNHLEILDEASVGAGARIRAEVLSLGRMSIIGERADIMARQVRIGDVLYMGSDVLIGGGGAWGASSRLEVGDLCLISRHCVLNTGSGIFIGNEVGLSPHVKLFTHNHWQSVLDGYHANFGPIVIEDRAYVTGDSLVVPGVRIGEGATVLANSTVSSDVAPYTMVTGNPARKVGTVDRNLSVERKERIVGRLMEEMAVELKGRVEPEQIRYSREVNLADPPGGSVTLTFSCKGSREDLRPGAVVFDLEGREVIGEQGAASDEVRNFLRRRGIRLRPIHWRYRRDAGMHNA